MSFINFTYLDSNTVTFTGTRNSKNTVSQYLRNVSGIPYNLAPFIAPFDCFLTNITASSSSISSWKVKLKSNGVDVIGGELDINNEIKKIQTYAIPLSAGQALEIYLETSTPISYPSVNIVLQKNI